MHDTHHSSLLLWGIYLLLPAILLLDLRAPLGVAIGMLYVVPLFATLWLTERRHVLPVAVAGSMFALLSPFFSPPAAPLWIGITNYLLILVTLWIMVLLIEWRGQAETALQRLSRQLLAVQENERRHLARELHDEVMQTLTALKLNLGMAAQVSVGAARQLEESMEAVDDLVEQIRNLSLDLRPSMLDDLGLVATLEWYCERQGRRLALPITFTTTPFLSRPSIERETTCFRVAQEALTNAAKHAQATQIWMSLKQRDGVLQLSIQDNGIGFDVAGMRIRAAHGRGLGLQGMEERLWLVGGQLDITSAPGQGTEICVRIPMSGASAEDLDFAVEVAGEPKLANAG